MVRFDTETVIHGSVVEVRLIGYLNENSVFEEFFAPSEVDEVYVDFSQVSHINSSGVNAWMNWVSWLQSNLPKAQVFLKKCPRNVVDQLNAVMGFLPPGGRVESLFLPFFCENCGGEHQTLVSRSTHFSEASNGEEAKVQVPDMICPNCQEQMELDVVRTKYFKFLSYQTD